LYEAEALTSLYYLHALAGAPDEALSVLVEAIRVDFRERASAELVLAVWTRLWNAKEGEADVGAMELADDALSCARKYDEKALADASFTSRDHLAAVLTCATAIAVLTDDRDTARWALPRAKAAIEDEHAQANLVTVLDWCRGELGN
jgi:hypothetical protein